MEPAIEGVHDATVAWLAAPLAAEELVQLFEDIADAEGWKPGAALRAYPHAAHHLAAFMAGTLTGGVQVVLPDADGFLPYRLVWPEVCVPTPSRTAHITVLALRVASRGRPAVFWSLCGELWRFLVGKGMEAVVLEVTPSMLLRYRRLGFPLEMIGGLRMHWGEECHLCRMDLRTVAGAMLMRARRSPIFRTLVGRAARSLRPRPCAPAAALP